MEAVNGPTPRVNSNAYHYCSFSGFTTDESGEHVSASFARQLERELTAANARADSNQARIDELMMEYCPDEITGDQLEEWGKHQRLVTDAEVKASMDSSSHSDAMK